MEDNGYQISIPTDNIKIDFLFFRKVKRGARKELLYQCTTSIVTPEVVAREEIENVFSWCYKNSNLLSHVSINLDAEAKPVYKLYITGIRKDGRCEFCKSFRTALKTHFEGRFKVYNDRLCTFENV